MAGEKTAGWNGSQVESLFEMGDQLGCQRPAPRTVVDRIGKNVMAAGTVAVEVDMDGLEAVVLGQGIAVAPAEAMDMINGREGSTVSGMTIGEDDTGSHDDRPAPEGAE